MKLATIALVVACLLAGCNSSTPTPVPPAPAGSPAARVEASAPVQAAPSSGDPAPSASAEPPPTPTPDPETVRKAAAAQYLAVAAANTQAYDALLATKPKGSTKAAAEIWGQFAADLKQLQVPADMAADLHDLIRKVKRVQALNVEASGRFARMDDFYIVARHLSNARSKMDDALDRVRSDLDLPALCRAGCSEPAIFG